MTSSTSPGTERAELIRALAVLSERPDSSHPAVAQALGLEGPTPVDHTELFVHQLPPYASIYLDPQGKIGGEARDRIAGFWRAVGLTPPAEPDHLASLLGLWAGLAEGRDSEDEAGQALVDHAIGVLVWEHLAAWLCPYLAAFAGLAPSPFDRWAQLLTEVVLAALPEAPDYLPHGLGEEPTTPEGPEELIGYLLAPVRSGLVLTRADLGRCARELGLGIRLGERAFALRSLVNQDAGSVLKWLTAEATRQVSRFDTSPFPRLLTKSWRSRLCATIQELKPHTGLPRLKST